MATRGLKKSRSKSKTKSGRPKLPASQKWIMTAFWLESDAQKVYLKIPQGYRSKFLNLCIESYPKKLLMNFIEPKKDLGPKESQKKKKLFACTISPSSHRRVKLVQTGFGSAFVSDAVRKAPKSIIDSFLNP